MYTQSILKIIFKIILNWNCSYLERSHDYVLKSGDIHMKVLN